MVKNTYSYCQHDRMGDACEDCAYQRAKDEGLPVPEVSPAETRAANAKRDAKAAAAVEEQPVITGSSGKVVGRKN